MKMIIDIPDGYTDKLKIIQNGSIACGQILQAVKNGKPYEERPKLRWTDKLSVISNGDIVDFDGQVVGHIEL